MHTSLAGSTRPHKHARRSWRVALSIGILSLASCVEEKEKEEVRSGGSAPPPATESTENRETTARLMSDADLREKLTPLQYDVTCNNGTEPPWQNEYWDNKKEGIYVDVISGKPLFSSTTKFDSGTGWPSFYEPLSKEEVVEVADESHGMVRIEVRSKTGDAHLGHVFNDGPKPTGLRYCLNSASLRFVPKEKLEQEGYGEYVKLFAEIE